VAHFLHRPSRHLDPRFLHEERLFLERERATLQVMERQRYHVVQEIERAKSLAREAHIPIDSAREGGITRLALIGVGDRLRRDDAAGPEVARRLRLAHPPGVVIAEQAGKPDSLLEAFSKAQEALVIDGVSSGAVPGTVHRFDVADQPLPPEMFRPPTHELGLADAVELGREQGRLPDRLLVYGIEGESFETGEGLTPAVAQSVAELVMELYRELEGRS